jgi:hypothetical protein
MRYGIGIATGDSNIVVTRIHSDITISGSIFGVDTFDELKFAPNNIQDVITLVFTWNIHIHIVVGK